MTANVKAILCYLEIILNFHAANRRAQLSAATLIPQLYFGGWFYRERVNRMFLGLCLSHWRIIHLLLIGLQMRGCTLDLRSWTGFSDWGLAPDIWPTRLLDG